MACGDRFRNLIRTADGKTWEDPCGLVCIASDAEKWHTAMRSLLTTISAEWGRYQSAAQKRGTGVDPVLAKDVQDFGAQEPDGVPLFGTLGGWTSYVDRYVSHMERGVCLLERIDDATQALGESPANVPGSPSRSEGWTVGRILFWGAVAVGGVLAVRTMMGPTPEAAA